LVKVELVINLKHRAGGPRRAFISSATRRRCDSIGAPAAIGAARVSVRTTGGKDFSAQVMHARGSLDQPMTDGEIEQKVRELASIGFPACDIDRVIDAVWELDRADDVRALMRLVAAG
jgi:2-methylcitrate dehydratase PrpD